MVGARYSSKDHTVAHIIVVGNEKGGSGKSTTSMHIGTALARMGHRVGALDLDLRQKSFARYVANRNAFLKQANLDLPIFDWDQHRSKSKYYLVPLRHWLKRDWQATHSIKYMRVSG